MQAETKSESRNRLGPRTDFLASNPSISSSAKITARRSTMKYLFSLAFLGLICGCGLIEGRNEAPHVRLGITYQAPKIPDDIPAQYSPTKNEKAFELLRDGATSIDLHEYYLVHYRQGWEDAARDFLEHGSFPLMERNDVQTRVSGMVVGIDAYWDGYRIAQVQIGALNGEDVNGDSDR